MFYSVLPVLSEGVVDYSGVALPVLSLKISNQHLVHSSTMSHTDKASFIIMGYKQSNIFTKVQR